VPRTIFNNPTGVCTGQDISVYVADYGHNLAEKASITGSVNVFAGNGCGIQKIDAAGGVVTYFHNDL